MRQGLVGVVAGSLALAALARPARAQTTTEVSRSSPIAATVDGVEAQYQGTFEETTPAPPVPTVTDSASLAAFEFPYTRGHLHAVNTALLGATTTRFVDMPIFEVVSNSTCAIPFSPNCRTIFTTIAAPSAAGLVQRPDRVFFTAASAGQLQPLLAPALTTSDVEILIERILRGARHKTTGAYKPRLGGIDRSTLAVIEPSPFVDDGSGGERPTMIYVGALDGMLHAFCAEISGPCQAAGQELWAFVPRTQLGRLRSNTQRIDGSIRVADVFDDFDLTDGAVQREFRTVLTFQTGSGVPGATDLGPSILALDVSNPADPKVLWERSTPSSRGEVDQGVGLGLAMGPVRLGSESRNLTFAQTNNGGTGSAGFQLIAIDTATGERVWTFDHQYPAPRSAANPAVPASGIPGGPAALDLSQSSFVTHVAVGSLYGDLWVIEADGSPLPSQPIFRFSSDLHPIGAPPTIYYDLASGRYHAVVLSGGYADPNAATWVSLTADQFAVSVVVDPPQAIVPMDEVGSSFGENRAFVINLGSGRLVTAQAIVAGNELFVLADKTDVNLPTYGQTPDTGSLTRFSLEDGAQKGSLLTITAGSGADVTATGVVQVGAGTGAMKVDVGLTGGGGAFDAAGAPVERSGESNNARLLWLNG
jgi:hypothetical protein